MESHPGTVPVGILYRFQCSESLKIENYDGKNAAHSAPALGPAGGAGDRRPESVVGLRLPR